jgi:hypothetical protein
VVSNSANAVTVTADCGVGNHAIGGGVKTVKATGNSNNAANVQGSYPSNQTGTAQASGTNPRAWSATFFAADPSNTAYAICVPN